MKDVEGYKEVVDTIQKLEKSVRAAEQRKALRDALKPVFVEIRAAAPVGSRSHRTYKGQLVSAGYLKRSLIFRTAARRKDGYAVASIQVKKDAFYGVHFHDEPVRWTQRTPQKAYHWFWSRWRANRAEVTRKFTQSMRDLIKRAVK